MKKFTIHLKDKLEWWDGNKKIILSKIEGTADTLNLQVVEGRGYIILPGLRTEDGKYIGPMLPVKESIEEITFIRSQSAEKKEDSIFDFCQSNMPEHYSFWEQKLKSMQKTNQQKAYIRGIRRID